MPMPVWTALLGIALAKKVVVFTAAKVYGIPKLYRKSQQLARWSITDKTTLKIVSGRIGYVYRVPNTFTARWFGPTAVQLASTLPSGPVPLQQGRSLLHRRAVKHHAFQMLQLIAGDRENGVGIDIVAECCSERMEFSTEIKGCLPGSNQSDHPRRTNAPC
ncbi:hypothetical protein WJX79_004194 [Trebouxia sp. C0005]